MAMVMLNGLPERFDPPISALDVPGDEKTFTFEFEKVAYFRKSDEINNVSKALSTKMKKAHSFLVNVMSPGVAVMEKVHENVIIEVSLITPLISASTNTPISKRVITNVTLCEKKL